MKPAASSVIHELLAISGRGEDWLAEELGISQATLEGRLSSSPCVSTLANTCAPLGYEVMLVPAGTKVEGGFRITE